MTAIARFGTIAAAASVSVSDESSDTTCFPLFAPAATGTQGVKSNASFTFDASRKRIGARAFRSLGDVQPVTTIADTTITLDATYDNDIVAIGTGVLCWLDMGDARNYQCDTAGRFRRRIHNATNDFLGVCNATGTLWERVPPRCSVEVILLDNSTAAGVWFAIARTDPRPQASTWLMEDFLGRVASNQYYGSPMPTTYVNGTSASLLAADANGVGAGAIANGPGTTAGGISQTYWGGLWIAGAATCYETRVCHRFTANANLYISRFGFGDNLLGAAHTNGVLFLYDYNTDGEFMSIKTINGSGSAILKTAVAPTINSSGLTAAGQILRWEVSSGDSGAQRADFWIDRVQVSASGGHGGASPYLPTTLAINPTHGITSNGGTGSGRYLYTDYTHVARYPTSRR